MLCPTCGQDNREAAKYCEGCGGVLAPIRDTLSHGRIKSRPRWRAPIDKAKQMVAELPSIELLGEVQAIEKMTGPGDASGRCLPGP